MKQTLTQRIEELEKQIDELRKEHDSLGDANENLAWDTEKRLQKLEPSTAMRSTGEWCVCPKPMQCNCLLNGNKCGECHSCHKLLKPQEDIREKIAFLRQTIPDMTESERKSGWYLSGYYKAIDRTLAIVKGE